MSKLQEYQKLLERGKKQHEDNLKVIAIYKQNIADLEKQKEEGMANRSLAQVTDADEKLKDVKGKLKLAMELEYEFNNGLIDIPKAELQAAISAEYHQPFYALWQEKLEHLQELKAEYEKAVRDAYYELEDFEKNLHYYDWSDITNNNAEDTYLHSNIIKVGDWNSLLKHKEHEIYFKG